MLYKTLKKLAYLATFVLMSICLIHLCVAFGFLGWSPTHDSLLGPQLFLLLPLYPWYLMWSLLASVKLIRGKAVEALIFLSLAFFILGSIWVRPGFEGTGASANCEVRVVTVNMSAYESDLPALSKKLAALEPDILLVQEIWRPLHAESLEKSSLPGHVAGDLKDGPVPLGPGLCIFTNLETEGPALKFGKNLLGQALLLPNGESLLVVTLHGLKVDAGTKTLRKVERYMESIRLQEKQIFELVRGIEGVGGHVVVGGDFNSPPTAPWLKPLLVELGDTRVAGSSSPLGLTFPSRFPLARLDRIYASRSNVVVKSQFTHDVGSDHKAVVVDLLY